MINFCYNSKTLHDSMSKNGLFVRSIFSSCWYNWSINHSTINHSKINQTFDLSIHQSFNQENRSINLKINQKSINTSIIQFEGSNDTRNEIYLARTKVLLSLVCLAAKRGYKTGLQKHALKTMFVVYFLHWTEPEKTRNYPKIHDLQEYWTQPNPT